jgi:predicted Zn-dependent peptidase
MEDILSWNIEDIREFHTRFYRPDNAVLIVSGDIDPQVVFAEAEKQFGSIENPQTKNSCSLIETNIPREPAVDGSKRIELHRENNEAETIAIVYSIPDFSHEDQVALSAISELLSAGKSGWLPQELVSKQRIANQVYGYNMELTDPGVFLLLAVANPGIEAEQLETALLEQIERIKNSTVSQAELDKVKINTKLDFIHTLESSSSLSDLYGGYLIRGDLTPLLEYEENLDKITPDVIRTVANRYFDNSKATTVILRKNNE